jgi:hypothetical protein
MTRLPRKLRSGVDADSDPNAPQSLVPQLTGDRSTFTAVNLSSNGKVTTYGLDLQATFAPFAIVDTGVGPA